MNGELANKRGDRRLQRQADAQLGDHVLFAREIEIGLDGRGAKHHVEAARSDLRHVARHDRVAALRHDRRLGQRPFGAHAERQKAHSERLGDRPASGEMAIELLGRRVRVVERRARKFELSARLERNGAAAVRVVEADQIAAVLDAAPSRAARACPRAARGCPCRRRKGRAKVGAIERVFFRAPCRPEMGPPACTLPRARRRARRATRQPHYRRRREP